LIYDISFFLNPRNVPPGSPGPPGQVRSTPPVPSTGRHPPPAPETYLFSRAYMGIQNSLQRSVRHGHCLVQHTPVTSPPGPRVRRDRYGPRRQVPSTGRHPPPAWHRPVTCRAGSGGSTPGGTWSESLPPEGTLSQRGRAGRGYFRQPSRGNQCSASRKASRWEHFGIKSQSNAHASSCRARVKPVPLSSLYVPPATPLRTGRPFKGSFCRGQAREKRHKRHAWRARPPCKLTLHRLLGEASYTMSPTRRRSRVLPSSGGSARTLRVYIAYLLLPTMNGRP
jgi:hypothetical protein